VTLKCSTAESQSPDTLSIQRAEAVAANRSDDRLPPTELPDWTERIIQRHKWLVNGNVSESLCQGNFDREKR
jgi:hypothetical protein